jgi:maltose O-acetyltransferase
MNLFWRLLCALGFKLMPLTRCFALRAWLLERRGGRVAKGARLAGGSRVVGRGCLMIGSDSWVGPYGLFFTHPDAPITIGARCDIAPEVCFITGTHEPGNLSRRAGSDTARPIRVGDGCWIGARVIVLAGVSIGDGAIVAAGAVVAADIEPNTLVGGVPARLIRRLGENGEAGCQA